MAVFRFSEYEKHHPRFMTEYGFQSFPEMKTVEAFTEPADRASIFTPVMLAHQKNNEGNSIIHDYLLKDYPEPKDFPSASSTSARYCRPRASRSAPSICAASAREAWARSTGS